MQDKLVLRRLIIVKAAVLCLLILLALGTAACAGLGADSTRNNPSNQPKQSDQLNPSTSDPFDRREGVTAFETKLDVPGSYVTYSQDGNRLLVKSDYDVRVWDTKTWKQFGPFVPQIRFNGVELDANGKHLLTSFREFDGKSLVHGVATLWDVETGKKLLSRILHKGRPVSYEAISPDGRLIGTLGTDQWVHLWRTDTGELHKSFTDRAAMKRLTFSPDGSSLYIATAGDGLLIWNLRTGTSRIIPRRHAGQSLPRFSSNGLVAMGSIGAIEVYDIATGELVFEHHVENKYYPYVWISPDGAYAAAETIWSVETRKELMSTLNADPVFDPRAPAVVLFPPENQAAGIWDLNTGECIRKFDPEPFWWDAAFSPDGNQLVAVSSDYTIVLFARPDKMGAERWKAAP